MKIRKMNLQQLKKALREARQNCPGSIYEQHLKERIKKLEGRR